VVLVKVWISDADDKVRDSHHPDKMAHQRPRINEPFIVGDEEAMYAGDPRLSAASRVNCRCSVSHIPLDSEPIKMLVPNLEPKERRRIAKRAYKALREKGVSSDDILEMLGEKACVSPLTIKSDVFSKRR
jgi:hypothetical protein